MTEVDVHSITSIAARYLSGLSDANMSENTIASYSRILKEFIDTLEVEAPDDIMGYHLENFIESKRDSSESTKNYYITVLRIFFRYAEVAGYISRNPSLALKRSKIIHNDAEDEEEADYVTYTTQEIQKLISACHGRTHVRDRAIIALLAGSGLRASELCSLDVLSWRRRNHNNIYVKRKGGAKRWVAVAAYVQKYVNEYLADRKYPPDNEPLFTSVSGKRLTRIDLYRMLKKIQERLDLYVGVHVFRHTFLTEVAKSDSIEAAQLLANHKSNKTTRGYVHSKAQEREAIVNNLEWADVLDKNVVTNDELYGEMRTEDAEEDAFHD